METAESRALHSDVKLNKAGVMFSFISPVTALTGSVMVPGKVRIFWRTVQICWEFWAQSLCFSALHRGESRHRNCRTWLLSGSICSCCSCPPQPTESPPSEGAATVLGLIRSLCRAVAWGFTLSAGWSRDLEIFHFLQRPSTAPDSALDAQHSSCVVPRGIQQGLQRSSHTFSMASALCPGEGHICSAHFPCWMPESGSL